MRMQRGLAFAMIALQVALLESSLFEWEWYPFLLAGIALLGVPGFMQVRLGWPGTAIAAAGVGIFVLLGINLGLIQHRIPVTPFLGGYAPYLGWSLLSWQTVLLYIRPEKGRLSEYFPVMGVAVLTYVGLMGRYHALDFTFHSAMIFFVLMSLAFWKLGAIPTVPMSASSHPWRRHLLQGGTLALALILAFVINQFFGTYRAEIDRVLFQSVASQFVPPTVGFSTQARLDSIANLQQQAGDHIALRVFSEESPSYLRGRAYDQYDNAQWRIMSKEVPLSPKQPPVDVRLGPQHPIYPVFPGRAPYTSYRIERLIASSGHFFIPLETAWLDTEGSSLYSDACGNIRASSGPATAAYHTFLGTATSNEALDDATKKILTEVPEALAVQIRDLASTVMSGCTSTQAKMESVRAYFEQHYTYHLGLKVPPGKDPLAYFLLEHPPAHCEYFAAGAAMLLRLGGVPCRYVTGFVATEYNDIGHYWVARNKDAHAWVEAYDVERHGWRTMEATVSAGIPAYESPTVWRRLTYVADSASRLIQNIGQAFASGNGLDVVYSYKYWILAAIMIIAMVFVIRWMIHPLFKKSSKRVKRPPRFVLDPSLRQLLRLRQQMDRKVRRLGYTRRPEETVLTFAARLESSSSMDNGIHGQRIRQAVQWYRAYGALRFRGLVSDEERDRLRAQAQDR